MISQRLSKWIWVVGLLALSGPAGAQDPETTPNPPVAPAAPAPEPQTRTDNDRDNRGGGARPQITAVDRTQAARGDWVTFSTSGEWPADRRAIAIYLDGKQVGTASQVRNGSFVWQVPGCDGACRGGAPDCTRSCDQCAGSPDDPACKDCRVPIQIGTHDLQIVLPQGENFNLVPMPQGTSQITLVKRGGDPQITGIFPLPSYPEGETYKIAVQGEGFSEHTCDNDIYLGGEQIEVCWKDAETCNRSFAGLPQGRLISTRKIELLNLSQADRDFSTLAIGVGSDVTDPVKIRLSRVARSTPFWWSLLGFAGITGLVLATTSRGFRGDRIAGVRYNFGSALLLDKETDTYSLSRFQFYLWTAVAILGYLYLAISRSLVQGSLDFVDIPDGLPGIVGISAGTSVLAQWTQSVRGPKGAGNSRPSFSDLITTGGVVAPERFQFFVWTVLGATAFLVLVILRDPGTIAELPTVPTGFLQLMGVSSVGYLGGKAVRKPGPVIDEVMATTGSLTLTVRGRGLSVDASFRIGTDDIPSAMIAETNHKPLIVEKDEQANDPTFAKVLRLTITEPKEEWLKEGAELTIINPDGQKATWPYQLMPVTAPPPEPVP